MSSDKSYLRTTPQRAAPYTPYSRRALSVHTLRRKVRNEASLNVLNGFLKHNWSAYSVSPLFIWSNREAKLKRYGRRISEFLAQTVKLDGDKSFRAKYEVMDNLTLSRHDDQAVQVTVDLVSDKDDKRVFTGYLLSWGCSSSVKPQELDGVLFLPVLICSGSSRVKKQVCRSLQTIHDCVTTSIHLHEFDRKELGFALLSYLEAENASVIISYTVPRRQNIGYLELEISSNLTSRLSSLIHEKCGKECSLDDVTLFWDEINEEICHIFSVKVGHCKMAKLQLSDAVITAEMFKATNVDAMHVILFFLTNKFVGLESAAPELGKR